VQGSTIDRIHVYVAGFAIVFDHNRCAIERMAALLSVQKCALTRSSV
jgi:hypothetical protein